MKNDADYERFCALLLEDRIYLDPSVTFPLICRWLSADARALDARLREEAGIGGRDLLATLRRREPERLLRKYGGKSL